MAVTRAVAARAEQIRLATPTADQRTLPAGQSLTDFAKTLGVPPDQVPFVVRALRSRNPHVGDVTKPVTADTPISVPSRLRTAGTEGPTGTILPPSDRTVDRERAAKEAVDRFVGTDPARVRELQALVGATQDGVFGGDTVRRLHKLTGSGELTAESLAKLWAAREPRVRGQDPRTIAPNDNNPAWRAEFGTRASVNPDRLEGWQRTFTNRLITEGLGPANDQRSQRERLAEFQRTRNITLPRGATPGDLTPATVTALRSARNERVANGAQLPATRFDAQVRAFVDIERPRLLAAGVPQRVVDTLYRRLTAMQFQETGGADPRYDNVVNFAGATGPLQATPIAAHDLAEVRHGRLPDGRTYAQYIQQTYGLGDGTTYTPQRGGRPSRRPTRGDTGGWDNTALIASQRGELTARDNGVSPHIAVAGLTYVSMLNRAARELPRGYDDPRFWQRVDRLYSGAAHDYNAKVNRFERLLTMGGYFDSPAPTP